MSGGHPKRGKDRCCPSYGPPPTSCLEVAMDGMVGSGGNCLCEKVLNRTYRLYGGCGRWDLKFAGNFHPLAEAAQVPTWNGWRDCHPRMSAIWAELVKPAADYLLEIHTEWIDRLGANQTWKWQANLGPSAPDCDNLGTIDEFELVESGGTLWCDPTEVSFSVTQVELGQEACLTPYRCLLCEEDPDDLPDLLLETAGVTLRAPFYWPIAYVTLPDLSVVLTNPTGNRPLAFQYWGWYFTWIGCRWDYVPSGLMATVVPSSGSSYQAPITAIWGGVSAGQSQFESPSGAVMAWCGLTLGPPATGLAAAMQLAELLPYGILPSCAGFDFTWTEDGSGYGISEGEVRLMAQ